MRTKRMRTKRMRNNPHTGEIIVREIPADLKKKFKSLCVDEDISMQQKIIDLIREWVGISAHTRGWG